MTEAVIVHEPAAAGSGVLVGSFGVTAVMAWRSEAVTWVPELKAVMVAMPPPTRTTLPTLPGEKTLADAFSVMLFDTSGWAISPLPVGSVTTNCGLV